MARPRLPIGQLGKVSILKLSNGKHRARARMRNQEGNLEILETLGDSEAEALALIHERARLVRYRVGLQLAPSSTVSEVAHDWLATLKKRVAMDRSTKGSLAENSYAEYDSVVRHLVTSQMGEVQMDQLSTAFIDFRLEQVMEEQSRSAAVRLKKVLQLICSHAVRRAALTVNPVREVQRLPGGDRRTSALSAEQWHGVVQLLRAWRQDQRGGTKPDTKKLEDILTIIIGTSLRIGEVLALRRADLDVMSQHPQLHVCGTVVITKTKGTHRQPVPKHSEQNRRIALTTTAQSVARYRLALTGGEADALLFPSKTGNPSTVSGIERLMRAFRAENAEALTELGIDLEEFTTHLFRRTAATFVERAGGLALAARLLGHANEDTTRAFYVVSPELVDPITAEIIDAALLYVPPEVLAHA
ncbi:tyrosine-type recombinase/integrase [Pseudoclavibacter terrae]|uniref:tyrosine-type recombinase/integrase n=1 Tax=Pseudoclavibacter terrae TaxID=1530195 RepID=UPI00232ADA11|nr:site-specific integrase [Pseudoclavibacter terrae]